MSLSYSVRTLGACLVFLAAFPAAVFSQAYVSEGGEYAPAGTLPGDQVKPDVSVTTSGGFIVWQDNITDGSGLGISARRLDSTLSGSFNAFRVNVTGTNDQENAKVVCLNGGGGAFVWQGGAVGAQQIYARFLSGNEWTTTSDIQVNTYTNSQHQDPAITKLADGSVVIVYSSYDQDGSLQGVYGQRLSATGAKIGGEFPVNVTTALNQRTASVAGLNDGSFVVSWISETQTSPTTFSVDVFARLFTTNGPEGGEFQVDTDTNVCANPCVTASTAGGFMVAWSAYDPDANGTSWDVFGRIYSSNSNLSSGGTVERLNSYTYGDQAGPRLASLGANYLAVWTSMGQDGSWEGVYGQFINGHGTFLGGEFRANTTTVSRQINPALTSDGSSQFLVGWASFTGVGNGFDLFAQRYAVAANPLTAPDAPFVTVLSSNQLSVTWPPLQGYNVADYEVYQDGATTPTATVTNDFWTATGLAPSSTHSYQYDIVLTDGMISPKSASATNTTYGTLTWGGIPFEWMEQYFGGDFESWPAATSSFDHNGVSLYNDFLTGCDPTDPASILKMQLQSTPEGMFLNWSTVPELVYQVQYAPKIGAWTNLGGPRYEAGTSDSLYLGGSSGGGFYRIVRLH